MNANCKSVQRVGSGRRRGACRAFWPALLMGLAAAEAGAQETPGREIPDALPGYVGVWMDDTGNGAVQIARCGENLCGRIVWLRNPLDEAGNPLSDTLNPNEAERARPICGLQVMGELKLQNDGSWDAGWIYDPKEGSTYKVALRLRASDRLEVTGYRGVKLLSETLTWKRAGTRLPMCIDTAPAFGATN